MKHIIIVSLLLTINCCNGQIKNNQLNNDITMEYFDIKKFEENKGKQGYVNSYYYTLDDESKVRELDVTCAATNYEKTYQREITKEFSPFQYVYTYYESGFIRGEIKRFNDSGLEIKEYDKNRNLIKETNFDKIFRHSFEQIREIILKEKGVDIYDTRQAIALRHNTPNARIKKYYQIHVLKSKLVEGEWYSSPSYSFLINDDTGKILTQEDIDQMP